MSLVQEPLLGGNSLTFADKCRKGIAKKQGKLFKECEEIFYNNIEKNNCDKKLAHYVWDVLLKVQRGYSFNRSHCLSYSLVALQEMNLAYKYPIIFWNCANLISDSGTEASDKATDYGKIARAIGTIKNSGIDISLININTSDYGFKPDIQNNRILYGLKALSNIGDEVVEKIKKNRPYIGIKDFMNRCPLTKTAMINLIKAGAFDEVDKNFNNRREVMTYYLINVSNPKQKLTLQNFNGLIQHNLIPKELELQIRVYNFTKFLKKYHKVQTYYSLDNICIEFLEKFLSEALDDIEIINGVSYIDQKLWDKQYYQIYMNVARDWLKENQEQILEKYNIMLFQEVWDKYASGNTSKWEMDSLCFYYGDHELKDVDCNKYGIVDFNSLSPVSEIDYYFKRAGRQIPIFKLRRIVGTVLAKDDNKHFVTLLTTTGVVNVKFTRDYYAKFKSQISEIQPDGTKKVMEKSWFKRGTLLMITGYRRDNTFVAKTYARTKGHQLYKITSVVNGMLTLQHDRYSSSSQIEDEYDESGFN